MKEIIPVVQQWSPTMKSYSREEEFSLELYLQDISEINLLTADEEKSLSRRYLKNGDQEAYERLITSNLRLVINIAKKYVSCGLTFLDLIEEGNLGLIKAVERFNPELNIRFSTYATCWIKHSVCRALTEQGHTVRIPSYLKKIISNWKQVDLKLQDELGYHPTTQEIVQRMNVVTKNKDIVKSAIQSQRGLERLQSLHQNTSQRDIIQDNRWKHYPDPVDNQEDTEEIELLLNKLDKRQAEIIRMRFGLGTHPPMTLKEIGEKINLTKERIRQLEHETIAKLKSMASRRSE